MKTGIRIQSGRFVAGLLFLLVSTQLIGCGWYLRPSKTTGGFGTGAAADASWGDSAGTGADRFGDAGSGFGFDGDPGADKTRLPGEPVAMLDTVYFDYDRSEIRPDQARTLEGNLAWIRQNPRANLRIEGHCDERGTQEYNLALGDRRADAVRNWLVARGVDPGRVDTLSKGELEPVVPGQGEAAWSRNRRGEFLILE